MEKLTNFAASTLALAVGASETVLQVASAARFPASGNFRILIDSELLLVTAVSGTNFTVTRGIESTTATPHAANAAVVGVCSVGGLAQYIAEKGGVFPLTGSRVLVTDSDGLPAASSLTTTVLAYMDATSSVQAQLNGKAATVHVHAIADTTGLQAALDAKAATSSLATVATSGLYSDLAGLPTLGTAAALAAGSANGVATLGGDGKVPTSQLAPIAITDVWPVASQVAQLALVAEKGDVAVRSDQNKSYIHNGGTAGTMADWTELLTPTDTVLSVNGQTGAVTLTAANVGAQASDATLTALAAYNTAGFVVSTGGDTFVGRSITGTSNQVIVSNGNGASGNVVLSLPQSINTGATPSFGSVTCTELSPNQLVTTNGSSRLSQSGIAASVLNVLTSWGSYDPWDLLAATIDHQQIDLSWNSAMPETFPLLWVIERSTDSVDFIDVDTTEALSYSDSGLEPETTYYYRVRAQFGPFSSYGSGMSSNASTQPAP